MESLLGAAAGTWGLFMAIAPLLQIRRMLTRRSSDDVSLGAYGVLLPGFVLWICYGTVRTDWVLVIPNVVALLVAIVTVAVAVAVRRLPTGPLARPATDPPDG